jgi:hypothetical protein
MDDEGFVIGGGLGQPSPLYVPAVLGVGSCCRALAALRATSGARLFHCPTFNFCNLLFPPPSNRV